MPTVLNWKGAGLKSLSSPIYQKVTLHDFKPNCKSRNLIQAAHKYIFRVKLWKIGKQIPDEINYDAGSQSAGPEQWTSDTTS